THVETTLATLGDRDALEAIHQDLALRHLLPTEHIVDGGYMSAQILHTSQAQYHVDVIGPVPANSSWQAHTPDAFDTTDFIVDWQAKRVTCPMGKTSRLWQHVTPKRGRDTITARAVFDRDDCVPCPLRSRCTHRAQGARTIGLIDQAHFKALRQAR